MVSLYSTFTLPPNFSTEHRFFSFYHSLHLFSTGATINCRNAFACRNKSQIGLCANQVQIQLIWMTTNTFSSKLIERYTAKCVMVGRDGYY